MDIYSAFLVNALRARRTSEGPKLPEGGIQTSNPMNQNSNVSLFANKFSNDTTNPLELNILNIQKAADINGDGEITDVEVQLYLRKEADTDKNGKVSGNEYESYIEKAMDANKDGKVSLEERKFFETLMMDMDGDGQVSLDDKIKYWSNYIRALATEPNTVKTSEPAANAQGGASVPVSTTPMSSTSSVSPVSNNLQNSDSANLDETKAGAALNKLLDKNGKGGALEGKGELIAQIAKEYDIPVHIFAAIIFAETGWGKSKAIRQYNNPGGIMDASNGCKTLKKFGSLEEGLRAMASNLKRNYFDKGLDTLAKIQPKYCPIGAANDPKGLNKNWLPTVTKISNQIASMC